MNPWEQDEEKLNQSSINQKTGKNAAITETFELIKVFEKERKDRNVASYRRNDAYWVELKTMHTEALADLKDFLEYLYYKKDYYRKNGLAYVNAQFVNKGKGRGGKNNSSSGGNDEKRSYGAGSQTRKVLEEYDSTMSLKLLEEADFMEKDSIKTFESQLSLIEADLKTLWDRGDRLLFAAKLSDLRAKKNFDSYSKYVKLANEQKGLENGGTGSDLWLSEVNYSVAAARSYEIKDECNKQLKFLFARAKEIEVRRRALIAKSGDTILIRQIDLYKNMPATANISRARVISIQTDSSDPLCDIGKTLSSRVELAHDSVALKMMADRDKGRDRGRDQDEDREMGYQIPGGNEVCPRLPFPLRSPSLLESATFSKQTNVSLISKTWSPVLLCLSSAGYIHIFDMDPEGEGGSEAASFSNAAGRSKRGIELDIFNNDMPRDAASAKKPTAEVKSKNSDDSTSLNYILSTETFMTPLASLSIDRCSVTFTPSATDSIFEIIETIPTSGVGSIFRATQEKRFILRSPSQSLMIDWIVKIQGQGQEQG
eukprot:CAMPEP_0119044670 /NCGR_PEP_ID=MMETSP1177-20130426/33414_1 /TAXON_ID=2985 /ORGANISM="Ochromonas sp, Strain CCMP1899" /LENGTH=541 /DNA_ID=CAMNT_0007015127 /DNA_START=39 /DNA_END=1661 /DNA_ORIENTATION=-